MQNKNNLFIFITHLCLEAPRLVERCNVIVKLKYFFGNFFLFPFIYILYILFMEEFHGGGGYFWPEKLTFNFLKPVWWLIFLDTANTTTSEGSLVVITWGPQASGYWTVFWGFCMMRFCSCFLFSTYTNQFSRKIYQ